MKVTDFHDNPMVCLIILLTLLAVAAVAEPAASAAGAVSVTGACGSPWAVEARPDEALNSVSFSSSANGWAVGAYANKTTALQWNGDSWTRIPTPSGSAGRGALTDVFTRTDDDAWAVGFGLGSRGPFIIHWDGEAWEVSPTEEKPGSVLAVDAAAPDDVWAVGRQDVELRFVPLVEHWDGERWRESPTPRPPEGTEWFLYGVRAIAPDDVWAVGASVDRSTSLEHSLMIHWDGADWGVVELPERGGGLSDIDGTAHDLWAVGGSDADDQPLALHWDGSKWTEVPLPDVGLRGALAAVTVVSPDDVWAAGPWSDGAVHGSVILHWDGQRWKIAYRDLGPFWFPHGLDDASPTQLWTVGHAGEPSGGPREGLLYRTCRLDVTDSGVGGAHRVGLGESIGWVFAADNQRTHVLADGSGMETFNSGPRGPRGSFTRRFFAAGGYPVLDLETGTSSRIDVPPAVTPAREEGLHVVWATRAPDLGFVYDVQRRGPRAAHFGGWRRATRSIEDGFASSEAGRWCFRARVRKLSDGTHTEWSPPACGTVR